MSEDYMAPTRCVGGKNHRYGPHLICRACGRRSRDVEAQKTEFRTAKRRGEPPPDFGNFGEAEMRRIEQRTPQWIKDLAKADPNEGLPDDLTK